MTAEEAYELTTQGGATDFSKAVKICRATGPFCLIGGLAVNCYVEPVYTLDADFVLVFAEETGLAETLQRSGFKIERFAHSINVQAPKSQLRVQFTLDPRYRDFPSRAVEMKVLGVSVPVASLEDLVQGKLWSYGDPQRRLTKRKKDELDLLRLAEAYPRLKDLLPQELRNQLG